MVGCAAEGQLTSTESSLADPPALPCSTIGYAGAVIDDGDTCFERGGPAASMRDVVDAGQDGDLVWTHTTDDVAEANFALWHFDFEQAGRYQVEVYTDMAYAQSKQATYVVQAGAATQDVVIDQTAVDGWRAIGDFEFEAGQEQWLRLGDNTGEPLATNVQLAFDAVRVTRVEPETGSDVPSDEDGGGCSTGTGLHGWVMLAALAGLRRRRSNK